MRRRDYINFKYVAKELTPLDSAYATSALERLNAPGTLDRHGCVVIEIKRNKLGN